ncbi:MAG: hypothetical protein GF328_08225, partial [Candidatus Latescibacteria bacterium]|nr:hypothetical protein [Candidatus Latescibacterota bacterium]
MDEGRRKRIEEILDGAAAAGRNQLLEGEVYGILDAAGIPVPRHETVSVEGTEPALEPAIRRLLDAESASGLVVKIQSPEILHKTEAGGIAFASADPAEAVAACRAVVTRVRERVPDAALSGILLVERVSYRPNLPGSELLLTLRQDAALGPLVVLGIGGVLTEWYGALAPGRTTWIASARDPIFEAETVADLAALGPAFRLLFAPSRLHERAPVDPESFWPVLRAWADLARTFAADAAEGRPVLEEIEVNPLAALPGGGVTALDGIGRFAQERPRIRRRRIDKVHNLLAPRSVAVIGASAKAMNPGRIILRNLRTAQGVAYGKIFPIHPKEEAIDSIPC